MSLNRIKVDRSQNDIPYNTEIENVFDNVQHLYSDKKRTISFGSSEVFQVLILCTQCEYFTCKRHNAVTIQSLISVLGSYRKFNYKFPIIEDTVKVDESDEEKSIIAYFEQHKIQELFHTLLTHILINMPEDPVQYLIWLLERFNLYVIDEIEEPPLVFKRRHIESIFRTMDIFDSGTITVEQYFSGLQTMGIFSKNLPVCNEDGLVTKEEFFKNAYSCQLTMVNEIVMLQMWWDLREEDDKQIEAISRNLLDSRHYKNVDKA